MINPKIDLASRGLSLLVCIILFGAAWKIGEKFGLEGVDVFFSIILLIIIAIILYLFIRLIILAVRTLKRK